MGLRLGLGLRGLVVEAHSFDLVHELLIAGLRLGRHDHGADRGKTPVGLVDAGSVVEVGNVDVVRLVAAYLGLTSVPELRILVVSEHRYVHPYQPALSSNLLLNLADPVVFLLREQLLLCGVMGGVGELLVVEAIVVHFM